MPKPNTENKKVKSSNQLRLETNSFFSISFLIESNAGSGPKLSCARFSIPLDLHQFPVAVVVVGSDPKIRGRAA